MSLSVGLQLLHRIQLPRLNTAGIRHFTCTSTRFIQHSPTVARRVIFSGIQPTGIPHLGNYLGALSNWVKLQGNAAPGDELLFSIVGWHALTLPQDPKELSAARMDMLAVLLAVGIDPRRSIVFHQDQSKPITIPDCGCSTIEHFTSVLLILLRIDIHLLFEEPKSHGTGMDFELHDSDGKATEDDDVEATARKTKDESNVDESHLNVGLFTYPILQAADILAYKATHVPVGEDQQQHLELSRDLADIFNRAYSPIFPLPQHVISPSRRILSLKDPTSKMSKSAPEIQSRILLTDTHSQIKSKIRAAVTDSIPGITYDPLNRTGTSNLLTILAACTGDDAARVAERYEGLGHGVLKADVADAVELLLRGPREEFARLRKETGHLVKVAMEGAEKARKRSDVTMREVRTTIGLQY